MSSRSLILSVNKPAGWTSFDVVAKLRRALDWKRVGHAGTLDPPATGVLIVLCGGATERADEFMALPKEYHARIRFGITTTTDDLEGKVTSESEISDWSGERILSAMRGFTGEISQVPPAVSAVKVGGRRAYQAARRGERIELTPRTVRIDRFDMLDETRPEIEVLLRCSRGTYVRSIARDLGANLGWGGALAALERTAVGRFRIEHALTLDAILKRSSEFASH
ncbi:MAG: tRNA pseudouridine(55) synthase TruB [bacterium]|nr:tRNA pseudouridine(55) synthase TruB [bacterium]